MTIEKAWRCALILVISARVALAQGAGVESLVLPSGLLVLVVHNAAAQKLDVSTAVFGGSRDDPESSRGIAHLAEHIAMGATRSGKSLGSVAAANDIAMSAVTLGDMTRFSSLASPTLNSLQTMLELERLRLSELVVSTNSIAAEVKRIRAETGDRLGDQHDGSTLFGAHRLSRSSSHADLLHINERELSSFVARFYVPGNAAIVIASPLATAEVLRVVQRTLGDLPAGHAIPRPIYRDSTRIVSTGRRGPVANSGGYGFAVTIPGLQHPSRPAIERDLAVLRMRLQADSAFASVVIVISDQSPASILSMRAPSGTVLDSALNLLDAHATFAPRDSQPAVPDLLQCEAAGDWHYCLTIAAARAAPSNSERLDALATYLRGSRVPLPLWP